MTITQIAICPQFIENGVSFGPIVYGLDTLGNLYEFDIKGQYRWVFVTSSPEK